MAVGSHTPLVAHALSIYCYFVGLAKWQLIVVLSFVVDDSQAAWSCRVVYLSLRALAANSIDHLVVDIALAYFEIHPVDTVQRTYRLTLLSWVHYKPIIACTQAVAGSFAVRRTFSHTFCSYWVIPCITNAGRKSCIWMSIGRALQHLCYIFVYAFVVQKKLVVFAFWRLILRGVAVSLWVYFVIGTWTTVSTLL